QLMSAGTGVAHSEYNPSATEGVHFLQIWLLPGSKGLKPAYQQTHFPAEEKRGRLRPVITPEGEAGSLHVNQDARVYAGLFDGAENAVLALDKGRFAYVHVARGSIEVNGIRLNEGDGLK